MTWTIAPTKEFEKSYKKLDIQAKKQVTAFLERIQIINELNIHPNFRYLTNDKFGKGRFQIGLRYRLIVSVDAQTQTMYLRTVGPRENFYKKSR